MKSVPTDKLLLTYPITWKEDLKPLLEKTGAFNLQDVIRSIVSEKIVELKQTEAVQKRALRI